MFADHEDPATNEPISKEALAKKHGVSRATLFRAVKRLKETTLLAPMKGEFPCVEG